MGLNIPTDIPRSQLPETQDETQMHQSQHTPVNLVKKTLFLFSHITKISTIFTKINDSGKIPCNHFS